MKGWLTTQKDEQFETKCHDICATYQQALAREVAGIKTVSIDEMTGVQALERAAPTLAMKAGQVERQEFEYVRHGTQTLIAGFNVATGQVMGRIGDTRTAQDFADFLQHLLAQESEHKGVAIFAKDCFGHPSPSNRQKLNATNHCLRRPSRPAPLASCPTRGMNLITQ